MDYRFRDTDPRVHHGVMLINAFHRDPAREEMQVRPTSRSIAANLDFVLRHSPNDVEALDMLLQYERAGGKEYGYPALECYIFWARQFVPNDTAVLLFAAQYNWKTGQYSSAEDLYLRALRIDPSSAEINYNIGLFYFSRHEYAKARTHARIAYAAGFPLPGLRNLLEQANEWNSADPKQGSGERQHPRSVP